MSTDDQGIFHKGEEFQKLFDRASEFTRDLMEANQQLRSKLLEVQSKQNEAAQNPGPCGTSGARDVAGNTVEEGPAQRRETERLAKLRIHPQNLGAGDLDHQRLQLPPDRGHQGGVQRSAPHEEDPVHRFHRRQDPISVCGPDGAGGQGGEGRHEVGPVLKKPENFVLLQTIAEGNDDYACGWVVYDRPWAKGPALWHNGSNTMNYCLVWFAPKRKFAAIVVTNVDDDSHPPCDAVVGHFIGQYLAGNKAKPEVEK